MTATLIAIDWGTTSLRAYLLGARGAVLDERAEPWGVARLPDGGFPAAFARITDGWPALPAIASGMVGSAIGWVEAPYVACPAGVGEVAGALVRLPGRDAHVVPGLLAGGDAPDVMRGEETQIVGALALHPELAERSVVVLPGTHAKWARVVDGRVCGFATYLTGELFAVLRDHSILGRPARDGADAPPDDERADAFARGVRAARESAGGIAPRLFGARALVLTGRIGAAASVDYLSGLLIGDELRAGLAEWGAPDALVGDPALCRRYAEALAWFGDVPAPLEIAGSAPAGLWRVAESAGLVRTASGGTSA